MLRLLVVVVWLWASPTFASGTWPVFLHAATNYTGGAGATGSLNDETVPRFTNSADGCVYAIAEVPDFCAAAPDLHVDAFEFRQLGGTGATGNVCLQAAVSVLTNDADGDVADWTFNTAVSVSTDLDTCNTNTGSGVCKSGTSSTFSAKDLGTGSNCASTACNKRTSVVMVCRDTGASCSGDSTTSVDVFKVRLGCN